ncbi:MAG: hypothetical protein V3V78_02245 [Candidatus Woesearchaeota archaeon]
MILGVDKLLGMVNDVQLVENLCDRELNNPEGAGFDLRIGEIFELEGKSFLGVEERDTPDVKSVAKYDPEKRTSFTFKPGSYYLFKTIENVNTPEDIVVLFRPRTTIFRSGMTMVTGNCSPGYKGGLTFAIANVGNCEVEIELGARVAHALFFKVDGKTNLYRGQWQGGRVTTEKKETQI